MKVLVTRPREDSVSLQRELLRRGIQVVLEPLLSIERMTGADLDLEGASALIFTSANGVRAYLAISGRLDLPVFTVGNATAEACGEAGFTSVASADGDVEDLAALIRRSRAPGDGRLIHIAGNVAAGNLASSLTASGFDVVRAPLYEARPASALSQAGQTALQQGRIDAALFFSPRTAAAFVNLARAAGLEEACRGIDAVCLSPAVAKRAAELPWRSLSIAAQPTQTALLDALSTHNNGPRQR